MSGTYTQCSQCGKRALNIATRCPQCGHEFPPRQVRRTSRVSDLARILPLLAVAGTLAGAAVLLTSLTGRSGRTQVEETSSVALTRLDTATAAASPAASTGERLFARTWTKVHTGRSTAADLAAVLLPGDTVVVDSLSRGWWRVALEGEVLGYVHQSTLATAPPVGGR